MCAAEGFENVSVERIADAAGDHRRGTQQLTADYLARQDHWDRWLALVRADAVLQRRFLEARARSQQRAARAIARLLDVDADRDPRPVAIAAAAMAATEAAMLIWEAEGRRRPRREVIDQGLDALLELSPLLAAPVPTTPGAAR